ncbi:hypothetical protein O181_067438 [Austropuccinia psidii MF-1]|uniref:Tc1-like transposase DDE domain-containing protein n=1 Tax=Austropuccinia psidii MF-1 TaxID=1389203 RepID=A0A9Q3I4I4_9BASI|nr:hypothetical protein [Austropuccinia psidii MF-1]
MGRHRLIFMEDNAPIHTETLSNKWPAHSPSLYPIENVWKIMNSSISKLYQSQTTYELQISIQSAWDNVPHGTLDNLLLFMKWRMEMVIAQNGGLTSH